MKKNNIFRSFLLYVYFIALFVATAGTVNYIEELILFNLRTNVICSDAAGFLDVPLMIVLAFCVHHGLLKLYKRFFEKTKISLNKTQFRVLIACLVFSIVLAVYSFAANKTEIYSDGNIKVYDYIGRVSEIRTVDEAEKVELKVDRRDYIKRNGVKSSVCTMEFLLYFPDGENVTLFHDHFKDVEALKTFRSLTGDKFIILQDREKAWELIGIADYELYEIWCELSEEENEDIYHSDYEAFEGTTYYQFGMGAVY